MKIGLGATFLHNALKRGHYDGISIYTESLLKQLNGLNIDSECVVFGEKDKYTIDHECNGQVNIRSSYQYLAAISVLSGKSFCDAENAMTGVDVFHATDHHIPKFKRTPVVSTIMDAIPFSHPEWVSKRLRKFKNYAFRKAANWSDHIITISEYSKSDIINYFGIPEEKISVIYLGFDTVLQKKYSQEITKQVKEKYNIHNNYFLFVGTIQPRKNLDRIIDAYNRLPKAIRDDYSLVIIGKYGWGCDSFRKNASNALKNIKWLTNVSNQELHPLMQSAAALVYPSLYEGFGLPVLEGFAANIPVISSNTTSIPEVAGDAALLVNPLDTDDISDAMRRIVDDGDLSGDLVKKGKYQLDVFSWENCAKDTIKVYEKFI